mmetsp:Transcript_3034/g.5825  ORF Transcript_3034/g.5825 Transcript_3034/m.5825 type:complete len:418 (-) Transcript_3034:1713-2966(-)
MGGNGSFTAAGGLMESPGEDQLLFTEALRSVARLEREALVERGTTEGLRRSAERKDQEILQLRESVQSLRDMLQQHEISSVAKGMQDWVEQEVPQGVDPVGEGSSFGPVRIADLEKANLELENQRRILKESEVELRRSTERRLQSLKCEYDAKLKDLQKSIEAVQEQCLSLQSERDILRAAIGTDDSSSAIPIAQLGSLAAENAEIKGDNEKLRASITTLENEKDVLSREARQSTASLLEYKRKMDAIARDWLRNAIAPLTKAIVRLEKGDLLIAERTAQRGIGSFEPQAMEYQRRILELESSLAKKATENASLERELLNAQRKLGQLEREHQKQASIISELQLQKAGDIGIQHPLSYYRSLTGCAGAWKVIFLEARNLIILGQTHLMERVAPRAKVRIERLRRQYLGKVGERQSTV